MSACLRARVGGRFLLFSRAFRLSLSLSLVRALFSFFISVIDGGIVRCARGSRVCVTGLIVINILAGEREERWRARGPATIKPETWCSLR